MISDFQNQINGFLLSVFFGVFLGALYDILRIIRKFTLPKRSVVFIFDFSFLSVFAVITFMASFSTNYGVLRAYHILGEVFGMAIYFITIGKATYFITGKILCVLGKTEKILKNNYKRIKEFFENKIKSKKMSKKGNKKLEKSKITGV